MKVSTRFQCAKVSVGFDKKPLIFVRAYLQKRKRTKFGSVSTDFFSIHYGVLQGSILGLLLHVIFTTDLFHINDNLIYAIYANDATHDVSRFSFAKFIDFLQLKKMFAWFKQNGLIANSGKRLFC